MFFLRKNKFFLIDCIAVVLLFALPYYLFDGKLFIGGDDRRLYYSFPWENLKNIAFYSWSNVASVGFHNPNQHQVPFLLVWTLLDNLFHNKIFISYLAFSMPLVFGFIYFKKFLRELIKNIHPIQSYIGALFYILSPIVSLVAFSHFLTWAFLVGIIPMVAFYLIRYVKTSDFSYIVKNIFLSLFFSITSYSVPWILGFVIPVFAGFAVSLFLFKKSEIFRFVKRSMLFFLIMGMSQLFWILPTVSMVFIKGTSFGEQINIISQSFTSTVNATAVGNIIFPLLNLFHRQLAMSFDWQIKEVFLNFYDKILFLNFVYLAVVLGGIYFFKKKTSVWDRKLFIITFSSFLISLYLFTVNIGILKDIFLLGEFLPLSVMFRNFYDKFALGFVFLFAVMLAFSIGILIKNFRRLRFFILSVLLTVILLNAFPIKEVINNKLWKTKSTYKTITIPKEYLEFVEDVENTVDPTSYVLNLPFNIGGYAIIRDADSHNVYAGTSPLKVFTGINDIAGNYSFPGTGYGTIIPEWWRAIEEKDYKKIIEIMERFRMNYVIVTKNIPEEVKNSYLFDKGHKTRIQDNEFLSAITDKKILTSRDGNYELYTARKRNFLIEGDNVYFQKISPVKYLVYLKDLKTDRDLKFYESFHKGWKLYPTNQKPDCLISDKFSFRINSQFQCQPDLRLFDKEDLLYLFRKPLFDETHKAHNGYFNSWTISPNGETSEASFVLYFMPQSYFYLGIILSAITFSGSLIYLILLKIRKNEQDT
jgi:hypothetical protein